MRFFKKQGQLPTVQLRNAHQQQARAHTVAGVNARPFNCCPRDIAEWIYNYTLPLFFSAQSVRVFFSSPVAKEALFAFIW